MILITNPYSVPCEMEIINALFEEGLEVLHVRKPDFDKDQLSQFIYKIDEQFHSRIMIHSYYELLDSFQIKGIHFTEKTKRMLADFDCVQCTKSLAAHELTELKSIPQTVDYVFLSPLFPSVSKEGYSKQWDFEELKVELAAKRNYNIVALGGITLENVKTVRKLGFNDFALLGSIWEPAKAGCSVNEIISIFKNFRNE
ncbi:MAG TPA: thiamine phosphate synthase [Paludibacter sp.]|nr:thiamine phosphate synthase [Paludibacter sp.]